MGEKVRCPDCGDVIDARACELHGRHSHDDPGRTKDDYERLNLGITGREGVVVVRDPDLVDEIQDVLTRGERA